MIKILSILFGISLSLYLSFVGLLFVKQRTMLFNPGNEYITPSDLGLTHVREIEIETLDGEKLVAWYRKADSGQPTILFMHGKGGTISNRSNRWKIYDALGYGILFFDYRGFGRSTGETTEAGLRTDALAAYDWLTTAGAKPNEIIVTGESLGTGFAVFVASQRPVAGVSLMSGYSSIADVAADRYWWVPVKILITDPVDVMPSAAKLRVPVLMQHGEKDRTIPIQFGRKLFDAIVSSKKLVIREGKGHNDFAAADFEVERVFIESLK